MFNPGEPNFRFYGRQAILFSRGKLMRDAQELTGGRLFRHVLADFVQTLVDKNSPLLGIFPAGVQVDAAAFEKIFRLMQELASYPKEEIERRRPEAAAFFRSTELLHQFVEHWYNHWRAFERTVVVYSDPGLRLPPHSRPFRTFSETIEALNHAIRQLYRDICENITGTHPRVYRQVPAGGKVGLIVSDDVYALPAPYDRFRDVKIIRDVLIEPPLLIDPPTNTRTGGYTLTDRNPLADLPDGPASPRDFFCYPALVGDLVVRVYFHNRFISLGTTLCNLFDLASEAEADRKPDAMLFFGLPASIFDAHGGKNLVFEDVENGMFIGAIPDTDDFGYFGYQKKMALTLHNLIMMRRGRLPLHGAMVKVALKNGRDASIVFVGDTGAGKSESLEAFRVIGRDSIRDMEIVFDDMGSLDIAGDGRLLAYGTETGAFVRLDDLQPGFAFGNLDRSVIMSPQKKNARVVLPVTTLDVVRRGTPVDYILYANNFDEVDAAHPLFAFFDTAEGALEVFREGRSMAKGTTSQTGLTTAYFVNIFGPPLLRDLHETLAKKYFGAMFDRGVKVGTIRTRLALSGFESKGPEEAAKALLEELLR